MEIKYDYIGDCPICNKRDTQLVERRDPLLETLFNDYEKKKLDVTSWCLSCFEHRKSYVRR